MAVNKGRIAKNAVILYVRMAIVLFISLFSARIVLDQLGASDYGTFNVVGGVITLFNFVITALSQGVQRFFNFYKGRGDYESVNKYFWSSLVVMGAFCAIIIVLCETVGLWFLNTQMNIPDDRKVAANWVFQFSIISMVIGVISSPYRSIIVAHEDFNIFAYISIGHALLTLLTAFLLKSAPFDKLIYYALLLLVIRAVCSWIMVIICRIKYKQVRPVKHREKQKYVELVSFSGWTTMGVGAFVLGTQGINIILNIFFGTVVNAARGVAFQIASRIDDFINGIQQATNPQIVQLYARGELNEVQSLVFDNMRWSFTMYWFIALPLIFEMDYVLDLWLVDVPEYTSVFTIIVILRSLLKCFERPINAVNFAIGKMKPINIFATISVVVTIVLLVLLFAIGFAPYWAFVMDCLSILLCVIYYMYHARKYHVFSFRSFGIKIALPVVLIVVASAGLAFVFRMAPVSGFWQLVFTVAVTTLLTGSLSFFILFTKQNREKVITVTKEKWNNIFKREN